MTIFEQVIILAMAIVVSFFIYVVLAVVIKDSRDWAFGKHDQDSPFLFIALPLVLGLQFVGMLLGLLIMAAAIPVNRWLAPWLNELGASYTSHYLNYGLAIALIVIGGVYTLLVLLHASQSLYKVFQKTNQAPVN